MPLFSKLIRCKHCGGNFKFRKDRKKKVYICSKYDNYRSCIRIPIEEDFLKGLIQRRHRKEMEDDEIRSVVDYIEVEDKFLLEIHFSDGSAPVLLKERFVQY